MKTLLLSAALSLLPLLSSAQSLLGDWTGQLRLGTASLTLVFHISQDADGSLVCTLDSPDQGAEGIPATVSTPDGDTLAVSVPTIMAAYNGRLQGDSIRGTFTQMGLRLAFNLHRGKEQLVRTQTPQPPFPYTTEDVTFLNAADSIRLAGTLTVPSTCCKDSTLCVLLVSGSGQQDRDETVLDHRPFLVLADWLARQGIATLRYDDRGVGGSTAGDLDNATTLDFMRDAGAGIDYLRRTGRFRSVGILGHSEGASIAFMLGAKGRTDFVVSLAGVGVKGDSALTAQVNAILQCQGLSQRITVSQYRAQVQARLTPWLSYFLDYDPTADLSRIHCPVLCLQGDNDVQVVADVNLPALQHAIPDHPKNQFVRFPGLNHLFQTSQTGMPEEYRHIPETICPDVLATIAAWLKGL